MDGRDSRGKHPAKKVFGIKELDPKPGEERGRSVFTPMGAGFANQDGSWTVYLDGLPLSGKLYIRDWDEARDSAKGRQEAAQNGGEGVGLGARGTSLFPGRSVPNEQDIPF